MVQFISDVGGRPYQEDRIDIAIAPKFYKNFSYYAVFDGHGGSPVSDFLCKQFRGILKKCLEVGLKNVDPKVKPTDPIFIKYVKECIFRAFEDLIPGGKLPRGSAMSAGSCAVVMLLHEDMLYVANVGDSRAIACVGKKAIPITKDHKPDDPAEKERIYASGGYVTNEGTARVNGSLAVSRAIGDLELAPHVSWEPDIFAEPLTQDIKFIVLASDGLWDGLDNQTVVNTVIDAKIKYRSSRGICPALLKALSESETNSEDNVSIIVVELF